MISTERKKTSLSKAWGFIFGIWLYTILIYESANPVGNFFDYEKLFAVWVFLSALIAVLLLAILRHFKDSPIITYVIILWNLFFIFYFSAIGFNFAATNPEGHMFIYGYLMIYETFFFCAVLDGIFVLLFISTHDFIQWFRIADQENNSKYNLFQTIFKQLIIAFLTTIILIFETQYIAVGLAYLCIGFGIGLIFIDTINNRGNPPLSEVKIIKPTDKHDFEINPNLLKYIFIVGGIFLSMLFIGYLWSIRFVRFSAPDPETHEILSLYSIVNPRLVLEDGLTTLCIALGFVGIIWLIIYQLTKKMPNDTRKYENLFVIGFCAAICGIWLWYSNQITLFGLRPANILYPLVIIFGVVWMIFMFSRIPHFEGVFNWSFFLGGLSFWLGFIISFDPDSDYKWIYFTVAVNVAILFLIFGSLAPSKKGITPSNETETDGKNIQKEAPLTQSNNDQSPAPNAIENIITKTASPSHAKSNRRFKTISILTLILASSLIFGVNSYQSIQNFPVLANVNNNCIFYLADPFNRVDQNYIPGFGAPVNFTVKNEIHLYAAKNEYESAQIVMLPINGKHFSLYGVSFTGFKHRTMGTWITSTNTKFQAYINEYIEALSEKVPDRLVPFYPLVVADGKNHPLWFTFYVPANTTAGDYNGSIILNTEGASWTDSEKTYLNVILHVYNFTLPVKPTLYSEFGITGVTQNSARFNKTMQVFKDHRMMRWAFANMPTCNVSSDGSIDFMNFTKMDESYLTAQSWQTYSMGLTFSSNPYYIFFENEWTIGSYNYTTWNFTKYSEYNTTLAQYWSLLESHLKNQTYLDDFGRNVSWFQESYFEGWDEVDARPEKELQDAIKFYKWLKFTLNMTIPIMQTMGDCAALREVVDIWCDHPNGRIPDAFTEWKAKGKPIWIYTTCGPRFPHPSIQTGNFGLQSRALGWQTWIYNYTHYLIWDVQTPGNEAEGFAYGGWNGGSLLYQAPNDDFYISSRLELVREGFEDHDYFVLLEYAIKQLNQTNAGDARIASGMSLLNRIRALMNGYIPIMDNFVFNKLRHDIGEYLTSLA